MEFPENKLKQITMLEVRTTSNATTWLDRKNPNCLNFLRLLFAWMVILSHAWRLTGRSDPLERFPQQGESLGSLAVNAFFIISGFLITASWMTGRGGEHYLRSRVLRIVPGFAVALIVSALIAAVAAGEEGPSYLQSLPKNRFLMSLLLLDGNVLNNNHAFANNVYSNAVNGSLWTIPFEFNCYLAVAFLGSLGLLIRRRFVAVIVLVSLVVYSTQVFLNKDTMYEWSRFATMFGFGAMFWIFRDRIPRNVGLAALSTVILLAAFFIRHGLMLVWPLAGSYLVFYIGFNAPSWMRRIGKTNDISYGVYLYAFPLQQLLYRLSPGMTIATHLAIASGLAIGFGWGSWLFIERPASRWKSQRVDPAI